MFVGWLMGAVVVIHCFALSAIVFSGPLLPFAAQGAGMMLFGGIAFCLLAALTSGYNGVLAVPQEVPATVLGVIGAGVVATMVGAPGEAHFMTVTMLLVVSGLITGVLFLMIGHFRLSNLFRFIPYPVAGGFFAGTGWVLSLAALSVMAGVNLQWETLPRIFDADMVWRWGPGAAYALVLAVIMRRMNSITVVMVSLVAAAGLYHLGLSLLDIPVADARARGLLLSGMPEGGLWPAFGLKDLEYVDWGVVAGQVPNLLSVTAVTLLCLLVYLNGLELATGVEVDLDREFRVAGIAGMAAAAGGSATGCHAFVYTLPCRLLGADTPWTGIVVAGVLCLTLFFGSGLLELIPTSMIGGLLLFIGLDLLENWIIRVRKRLHWTEYGLVVLICVTIAVFGFIEGVSVGMLATLALFAARLSRIGVVEEEFTGRDRHSTKIRSVPERTILWDRGERLRAYRLRGYIFFGSAHLLVDRLKEPLGSDVPPTCVLLDFAAVSTCDFSAVNQLCQFVRLADSAGAVVVVSTAPKQIERRLRDNLPAEIGVRFETDFDHGLERCEDVIVAAADQDLVDAGESLRQRLFDRTAHDMERYLEAHARFEDLLDRLEPWLEPREYEEGGALAVRGKVQDGLQFLVSGQASVHGADGARLYQYAPGDVIESWAAISRHRASATTIALSPCRTMLLTPAARELLMSNDYDLTLRLFSFLVDRPPPGGLFLIGDGDGRRQI